MRRTAAAGFTLLEVLIAVAIFAFVAVAAEQTMVNSDFHSGAGQRARELRMLAERKLGEILAFEQHYDDNFNGEFKDEYPEYGDRFEGWKWELEVRGTPGPQLVVFGLSNKEDASYLFGAPTDEEKAELAGTGSTTGGTQAGQAAKKGETQEIRELTLRVSTPDDGGVADSVELVVFAPIVPAPVKK